MKSVTLEEYKEAGEEFFPKYFYVAKELGEESKPEEVLKVMEALAGVAMKQRIESKMSGPFGFNKKNEEDSRPTE